MVQTFAASDREKKREMGACQIGCNTRIRWHRCASARWFAACFRYDCITTWGHHHAYHLSGQSWQCGGCPSETVGTQRQSCTDIFHDAVLLLLLLLLTSGNSRLLDTDRQTTFPVWLTMTRMLIKGEMGKAGKSTAPRTGNMSPL